MADPVAEKSSFLRMYMSSHPDTLVAYAKWYGKVKEPIESAEMSAISTKNMTLTCTLKNGYKKTVEVVLDPPLSGYDDVKPRLLEMKSLAQEGLGMIKTPQITSFYLPREIIQSSLFIATLLYFSVFPRISRSSDSEWLTLFWTPAQLVWSLPYAGRVCEFAAMLVGMMHIFETLYIMNLCRKHTGFFVGAAYVCSVAIFGFPVLKDLRKRIQKARIDSVMKVE